MTKQSNLVTIQMKTELFRWKLPEIRKQHKMYKILKVTGQTITLQQHIHVKKEKEKHNTHA